MNLSFLEQNFVDAAQRDLMQFTQMFTNTFCAPAGHPNYLGVNSRVFINTMERKVDVDNPLMVTITFNFQVFKNFKQNEFERWQWVAYRAENFACANYQFIKLLPHEI